VLLALVALLALTAKAAQIGVVTEYPLVLGDTQLSVVEWQARSGDKLMPRFLNLHQNENCSVVAAKSLLQLRGAGSVLYFNKTLSNNGWPTRNITFSLKGTVYTFDPNRMFTAAGLETNLYPYSSNAAAEVLAFSQKVLSIYVVEPQQPLIAIHNNAFAGSLSALQYLPGGVYGNDAINVNIGTVSTPKEFFLLTDTPTNEQLYQSLVQAGYSVVLQTPAGPNSTLTDDGSLSVYCALVNPPLTYVNIEATAPTPDDHEGFRQITQLAMFHTLVNIALGSSK